MNATRPRFKWTCITGGRRFGRKVREEEREVRYHVEGYQQGRRLMRFGDGADEWIGMAIAKKHLLVLIALGRDELGKKSSVEKRAKILRLHGLYKEAERLEIGAWMLANQRGKRRVR